MNEEMVAEGVRPALATCYVPWLLLVTFKCYHQQMPPCGLSIACVDIASRSSAVVCLATEVGKARHFISFTMQSTCHPNPSSSRNRNSIHEPFHLGRLLTPPYFSGIHQRVRCTNNVHSILATIPMHISIIYCAALLGPTMKFTCRWHHRCCATSQTCESPFSKFKMTKMEKCNEERTWIKGVANTYRLHIQIPSKSLKSFHKPPPLPLWHT